MVEHAIILERAAPPVSGFERPDLSLKVEQNLSLAKLRVYGREADFRFKSITGFSPPPPQRQCEKRALTFAWLAPGEWLIAGSRSNIATWLKAVNAQGNDEVLAVDVTHARVSLVLAGNHARTAIAAHCPLDLWGKNFPLDAVARSMLGDTTMFIARLADEGEAPRFRIIVDQSMAPYAARILARG